MYTNRKVIIVASIIFVFAAILLVFVLTAKRSLAPTTLNNFNIPDNDEGGKVAGVSSEDQPYLDRLAIHLTDNGAVLFGAYWSEQLVQQKSLFGPASDSLNYVECDQEGLNSNIDECIANDILVYPTWVLKGKKFEGFQSLSDLAKISGF